MNKYVKLLFVAGAFIALFSSCKKTATTDTSILEGHKWVLTSALYTYNDTPGKADPIYSVNPTCTTSGFTQFYGAEANTPYLMLMYTYTSTTCSPSDSPNLSILSWNIDPDNTLLYLGGSKVDGTGGVWFTIQTLNNSTLVYTYVNEQSTTHTVTATYTYTAQ